MGIYALFLTHAPIAITGVDESVWTMILVDFFRLIICFTSSFDYYRQHPTMLDNLWQSLTILAIFDNYDNKKRRPAG